MRIFKSKRTSLLGLTTVLGLSTTLNACQFGNYSDPYTPIAQPSTFSTTDLYQTHASTLSATVYRSNDINDDTATVTPSTSTNAPLVAMPSFVLNTFTSPVYYLVPTDTTQTPEFASLALRSDQALPAGKFVDNTFSYTYNLGSPTDYYQFNNSNVCGYRYQITESATRVPRSGTYTDSTGTTVTTQGNLSLTLTYSTWFIGDCASTFSALATCYLNGSGCSSDMIQKASDTFGLYVRAGLLNLSSDDLTKIKGLEFTAQYDNN